MTEPVSILICEDDYLTLKALEHTLKHAGYSIMLAKDGKEARELLRRGNIQVLLTDIHVPYFSGLELIRYVREELNSPMPVLVLSRVGLEDTIMHAFELGANDYITKPFNPGDLLLRLKKMMSQEK
ncbi:MAG: response regulator [Bacteroidales bacterium]